MLTADRGRCGAHRAAQAVALVLIGFGVLLRPNAIVAAPLLVGYVLWPMRFDWQADGAPVRAGARGRLSRSIHLVYYVVLDVKRENPLHSVLVFDLGGITHFSGENQFPVDWSAEKTALLTIRCYNPDRWDSYWTIEPCRFVMARLERPDDVIFGTPRLDASVEATPSRRIPLAYLRHRLTYLLDVPGRPPTR